MAVPDYIQQEFLFLPVHRLEPGSTSGCEQRQEAEVMLNELPSLLEVQPILERELERSLEQLPVVSLMPPAEASKKPAEEGANGRSTDAPGKAPAEPPVALLAPPSQSTGFSPAASPSIPTECYRYEAGSGLLNALELSTVLEMLAVIQSADELDWLDYLTPAQKHQVWNATPAFLKARLHQIRQVPLPELPLTVHAPLLDSLAIGDRVVLKARPELNKAELMAIFEVVALQENSVQCKGVQSRVHIPGTKWYPVDWLLPYPKTELDTL